MPDKDAEKRRQQRFGLPPLRRHRLVVESPDVLHEGPTVRRAVYGSAADAVAVVANFGRQDATIETNLGAACSQYRII